MYLISVFPLHLRRNPATLVFHCWLDDRKDTRPVKKAGCWCVDGDIFVDGEILTGAFARLVAPIVTNTSVILSSNKVQKGDILVPANPGPPGNGR